MANQVRERLALHYPTGDDFLTKYTNLGGVFVESQSQLPVGTRVALHISTGTGQGPLYLSARVVYLIEGDTTHKPGFGLAFELVGGELNQLESFLIAVQRGLPWPDKSGRMFERFAIALRVEYTYRGEERREHTDNLSRGGLFVSSFDPPEMGTLLNVALFAPGVEQPVLAACRVTHVVTAQQAQERNVPAGAGLLFEGDTEGTLQKLNALLAADRRPKHRRAMVVDDDAFFRTVLGNMLRLAGFEVIEAADGNSAFRILMEQILTLDILVVDLYMPGMTGIELVDQIRRVGHEKELAVILVTGADLSSVELEGITRIGADDVLSKILSPEQMLERIETAVQKRAAVDE